MLHRRLNYMIYLKRRHCFISLTIFFHRRQHVLRHEKYRARKNEHKSLSLNKIASQINTINSRRYDNNINYLSQRIDLNRDINVYTVDKHLRYEHTHVYQCKLCMKDSRRLFELITFNIRISFIFFKLRWVSARYIQ